MPDAATLIRDKRYRWARPGSGHDRMVKVARLVLPLAIGVLTAFLAISPLSKRAEISFVLAKDRVAMATERMRVGNAQYRGQDDKGRPFRLHAGSAVQATSKVPVVRLGDLSANIQLDDGPATLSAPNARYDMDAEQLRVDGPLTVAGANGYQLSTRDVGVDLNTRTLGSNAMVAGRIPLGTFSAGNMRADLGARTVTLGGRARLHIVQGRAKGRP